MAERRKKIAVVITHGMGEQIPMETLRSFVEAAWVKDPSVQWESPDDERPDDTWIKPDAVTGSLELRRITTRWTKSPENREAKGPRVDFFEFYWADLAEGTTVHEVWDWLRTLLWPRQVPKPLLGAWRLLWLATVIVTVLSLLAVSPWPGGAWHAIFAAAALVVGWVMQYVVSPYLGDVARYVRADPRNIAMRRAIRERGLKLLNDLHASGDYNRIIFVAHSLGTIIAYDLISLFWAVREQDLRIGEGLDAFSKLRAVETAAHALVDRTQAQQSAYRDAQRAFRLALRSGAQQNDGTNRELPPDQEWLISDLVTLGSPLTHAAFLLARDEADLGDKIKSWLFPTNPPQFQKIESEQREKINAGRNPPGADVCGPAAGLFSYFVADRQWAMHHAAPFAAVRWTNIYDPHQQIFQGDIISGPLAPVFGVGIRDINLKALRGQSPRFSHTLYWTLNVDGSNAHIDALRKAIDLLDRPDAGIWGK